MIAGIVSELINIRINDIDLSACSIKIYNGKGGKDLFLVTLIKSANFLSSSFDSLIK